MLKILILTCFSIFLIGIHVRADHLAGGYFEYSHISGNDYEIRFYFLRDCEGITADDPNLYLKNDCDVTSCIDLGTMTKIEGNHVDYGCGNTCDIFDAGKPGFRLIEYRKTVTLWLPCDSWILSVNISARNDVDYVANEGSYYNHCKINNNVVNDSPNVVGENIIVGCSGYTASALYSVTQTNGDVLVYDIIPPKNALGGSDCSYGDVEFEPGMSSTTPFPSQNPMQINPVNGKVSIVPDLIGTSYFAVRVQEYRTGQLIGEIIIDGMIYVQTCGPPGNVSFGSFPSSGDAQMVIPGDGGSYCETVQLTSNEPIIDFSLAAPPYVTYTTTGIGTGSVYVTLCVQFPPEVICSEVIIDVIFDANTGEASDCIGETNGVGDKGHYTIKKLGGDYCPENLYYTNRSPQGLPMPSFATAEERIWVGDHMPIGAPTSLIEGPVDIEGDVYLKAGIEVILPSCVFGTGCVTITGNTTIEILPNYCSADCPQTPLDLSVKEEFNCDSEKLIATVNGSTGPYSYTWSIDGQTITTTSNEYDIHTIISNFDGIEVPYTCYVQDAIGGSNSFSGEVWGTKKFYEDIRNQTTYHDFPVDASGNPASIYGLPGYYYDGNIWVVNGVQAPSPFTGNSVAFIYDGINYNPPSVYNPPFYGATELKFTIWDSWGIQLHDLDLTLEGGDDWSFDNYGIYWNGHMNNDLNQPCAASPTGTNAFNYRLITKNCLSKGVPSPPITNQNENIVSTEAHIENATFFIAEDCYEWDFSGIIHEKSMAPPLQGNRGDQMILHQNNDSQFGCAPNPSTDILTIYSLNDEVAKFKNVEIIDNSGRVIIKIDELQTGENINVLDLNSGTYIIKFNNHVLSFVKI
ncbi:MAG: T9SS type A sorting domain-containing protein [Crocinitomicaceae bacterium]|nr:T9SS type A sorting domain-containing protein [Crocinitomicaceae bacterium]